MFEILKKSLRTGIVTTPYPTGAPELSSSARGRPEIDFRNWKDARPAAQVCPTQAISFTDKEGVRIASLDLGKCVFCGLCAEADAAIRITNVCEFAARRRTDLTCSARYRLNADGTHDSLLEPPKVAPGNAVGLETIGVQLQEKVAK